MSALPPLSIIGILGGGQLGRMLALAAARLGLRAHIYCPQEDAPAFEVAAFKTIAAYNDEKALRQFAQNCDVVTYEFENIPLEAADIIAAEQNLFPSKKALEISQDRSLEKTFLTENSIPVADWWKVAHLDDLDEALRESGTPVILKTRRLGYDGKGQATIRAMHEAKEAFHLIGEQAAIIERFVPFEQEISVILASNGQGDARCYDVPCNEHGDGILQTSKVPCNIDPATKADAQSIATKIATALSYQGVLAVEFFVTNGKEQPRLIINEFAPRVHNTGHWTMDACQCDQFENHIRAVAGWPLGSTQRHSDAVMSNLLGEQVLDWHNIAGEPDRGLHLYGKKDVAPGRKLGHVTRISPKTK